MLIAVPLQDKSRQCRKTPNEEDARQQEACKKRWRWPRWLKFHLVYVECASHMGRLRTFRLERRTCGMTDVVLGLLPVEAMSRLSLLRNIWQGLHVVCAFKTNVCICAFFCGYTMHKIVISGICIMFLFIYQSKQRRPATKLAPCVAKSGWSQFHPFRLLLLACSPPKTLAHHYN